MALHHLPSMLIPPPEQAPGPQAPDDSSLVLLSEAAVRSHQVVPTAGSILAGASPALPVQGPGAQRWLLCTSV